MNTRIRFVSVLLALTVLVGATPGTSTGASTGRSLWVTNDGIDSPTCGARSRPCRSISQGIENAVAGDTIEVGAGRYGDLNDDDVLGGPGEEHGSTDCGSDVCISKALTIVSVHGADQTVIVGAGEAKALRDGVTLSVVEIFSSGVTFGLKDHGFTLVGAQIGVRTHGDRAKVAGNTAITSRHGFLLESSGSTQVSDNMAIDIPDVGFLVDGDGVVLENNTAIDCAIGFLAATGSRLVGNVAARSRSDGFQLGNQGGNRQPFFIEGNTAVGNSGAGFRLGFDIIVTLPASVGSLRHNTIVGNTGPGILLSGHLLRATGNFWGSSAGPGADPADNARGECDLNGSATIVTPFAKEFQ